MSRGKRVFEVILIFLLAAAVSFTFLQFLEGPDSIPHKDSAIFINIGSEILKGKILYQQIWDNKLPVLYLINALGLWLGNGSLQGVWAVELFFLLVLIFSCYVSLRKFVNPFLAFSISLVSFYAITPVMSGNFSEEYAICIQMATLALFVTIFLPQKHKFSRIGSALGIGLLTGISFCIKPTYIDVTLSILCFMIVMGIVKKDSKVIRQILAIGLGFLLVNAIFIVYFAVHNSLHEYIFSAFLLNKYYSTQGLIEWRAAFLEAVEFLTSHPLFFVAVVIGLSSILLFIVHIRGYLRKALYSRPAKWVFLLTGFLCLAVFLIAHFGDKSPGVGLLEGAVLSFGILCVLVALLLFLRRTPVDRSLPGVGFGTCLMNLYNQSDGILFLFIGALDLAIVVFAISLSGMNFPHYFISLFPSIFMLLAGAVIFWLQSSRQTQPILPVTCVVIAMLLASGFDPTLASINWFKSSRADNSTDERNEIASYLKSSTSPQQKILVWGWESIIYFRADREAPTRYTFQFPAYFKSPYRDEVQSTILNELLAEPPAYIVDTNDQEMPFIEGKSMSECIAENPADGDGLQKILNYVCKNYTPDKKFGDNYIYKRNSN